MTERLTFDTDCYTHVVFIHPVAMGRGVVKSIGDTDCDLYLSENRLFICLRERRAPFIDQIISVPLSNVASLQGERSYRVKTTASMTAPEGSAKKLGRPLKKPTL